MFRFLNQRLNYVIMTVDVNATAEDSATPETERSMVGDARRRKYSKTFLWFRLLSVGFFHQSAFGNYYGREVTDQWKDRYADR